MHGARRRLDKRIEVIDGSTADLDGTLPHQTAGDRLGVNGGVIEEDVLQSS
jgi:hypothetical protein